MRDFGQRFNSEKGALRSYLDLCSCELRKCTDAIGDPQWMCEGGLICAMSTKFGRLLVNFGSNLSWGESLSSFYEWVATKKDECNCEWKKVETSFTVEKHISPIEDMGVQKVEIAVGDDWDSGSWTPVPYQDHGDKIKKPWDRYKCFLTGSGYRTMVTKKTRTSLVRYYMDKVALGNRSNRFWMTYIRLRDRNLLGQVKLKPMYEEQSDTNKSQSWTHKIKTVSADVREKTGFMSSVGKTIDAITPESILNLSEAMANGNAMVKGMREILGDVQPMLGNFTRDFTEFTAVSREALEMSKGDVSFVQAFDKMVNNGINIGTPTKISAIEAIIMVMSAIYLFCTLTDWKQTVALVVNQFAALGVGSRMARWVESCKEPLKELRKEYTQYNQDYQEQSLEYGNIVAPLAYLISTGITTFMSSSDTRPIPHYQKVGQVAQSFNQVNSMSKACEASLLRAGDMLWEAYTGLPRGSKNISELSLELEMWMEAVARSAGDVDWMKDFTIDHDKHKVISDLVSEGRPLIQLIKGMPRDIQQSVLLPVNLAMRTLTRAQDILKQLSAPSKNKVEPVSIVFMGGTGVGKTTMVRQFAIDLMAKMPEEVRKKYTKDRLMFTKDKSGDYYDGYDGHFAFFMDEMFQSTQKEDETQDALTFITLVNSHSTPLNMAQLEMKNKICFTSPFIIVTTNAENWDNFSIRCPPALKRRRGIILEPVVKPEFRKNGGMELDGRKWMANSKCFARPQFATFTIKDGDTGVPVQSHVEYWDVINQIMDMYYQKAGTFHALNTYQDLALEAALNGQVYEPQSDNGTVATIVAKLRSQVTDRTSQHLIKNELPVQILLSQLKLEGELGAETFETDLERQPQLIKEWVDIWGGLSHEKKVEATLMITLTSTLVNGALKKSLYQKTFNVRAELLSNLKEGATWDDLKISSVTFSHPLHDWKSKVSSYFRSFKEKFPWKEVVTILTSLAALGGLAFGIYWAVKAQKAKKVPVPHWFVATKEESDPLRQKNKSQFQRKGRGPYKQENRILDKSESQIILTPVSNEERKKNLANFHIEQNLVVQQAEAETELIDGNEIGKQSLLDIMWEEQAILDQAWEDTMLTKVVKNCCIVTLVSMGCEITKARGIIVCTNFLLVPKHFYKYCINPQNTILEIVKTGGTYSIDTHAIQHVSIGDMWKYDDALLLRLPPNKVVAADITKYFIKRSEVPNLVDTYGELVVPSQRGLTRHATHIIAQEQFLSCQPDTVTVISQEDNRHAVVGWHYLAATKKGDCGSPLIRWDPSSSTKIIGIHAAGHNSEHPKIGCFATIVDQEFLVTAIASFGNQIYTQQSDIGRPFYGESHLLKPAMEMISYVSKQDGAHMPVTRTKIRPSLFHGVLAKPFSCPVLPSMAAGGSLDKVLSKFQRETPYVDRRLVNELSQALYYKAELFDERASRKLLPWDVVVQGLDDLGGINPVSSMGYPYSNQNIKKVDILELVPHKGYVLRDDTDFYKTLMDSEKSILKGISPEWIWATYMKDERIKREKALAGKIRLFMACPFDLTLLSRRYFGNFIDLLHRKRFEVGCLVGIDPHSIEWHKLAISLLEKNSLICTEDFSNWDRTVPKEFLEVFFKWARQYYGKGYTLAHEVIEHAILCPIFQTGYFRYRVPSGNPSGSPFTSEMNSISNIVITMYCIIKTGIPAPTVLEDSRIFSYGDDKVWTAKYAFDMGRYVDELTKLGLTVTSPRKDGSLPELQDITQIDFLQRRFGYVDGEYRGQLKLEIIIESLLWVSGPVNQKDALEDTVRSAFVELQQYEPVKVGELLSRILHCCTKFGVSFPITEHLIRAMDSREESWAGTNLENLFLHMGGAFWNQSLSYDKLPVTISSLLELKGFRCYYVGLDIVKDFPIITKGVFYHTGFRFKRKNIECQYELVFSDRGVVWVPALYKPHFSYPVNLKPQNFIDSLIIGKKYHKIRWNCIAWAEWVMYKNGITPPVELHKNLVDFARSHYSKMMYEEQTDGATLADGVTPFGEDHSTVTRGVFTNMTPTFAPATTREFRELLETEAVICSDNWTTDQSLDVELKKLDLPTELLKIKQFAHKLDFNALFSANIKITLKVSSNQFQAGQLLLVWEPLGQYGMAGGVELHTWAYTAMPSVIINASVQNEVSMTIPFISPFNFVRLNETPKFGYLRLRVLNSLTDQSSQKKATYTFYANFTDVVVMAPTPLVRTSGSSSCDDVFPALSSQADEATEKTKLGIISGVTSKVAAVADLVGKIPVFSTIAGTVSAVAHVATDIATFLGLSKPNSLASTQPMIPRPFTAVSYADGLDMSIIVGTSSRNHVVIQPSMFGSCVDEMSIEYITKTPQVIDRFEWRSYFGASYILRTYPVVPTVGGNLIGFDTNRKYCQLSPMGYVAVCSKYWRGSIQFKFQFVATGFHQGRVAIGYVPLGLDKDFDLSTTSHIKFDLGEENTVEFTVPFVSDRMYNRVPKLFETVKITEPAVTGIVVVKVLNGLTHPDSVFGRIEVNTWVCGGSDLEFAVPTLDQVRLYDYGYKKPASIQDYEVIDHTVLTQKVHHEISMAMDEQGQIDNGRTREQVQLGPDAPCIKGFEKCACEGVNGIVMGETIYSLRDILKIFVKKFSTTAKLQTRQLCYDIPAHSYLTKLEELEDTYYDHLTRMYRMSRGSVRQKLIVSQISGKVSVILNVDSTQSPFTWYASDDVCEGSPWGICVPQLNPTLEYMVPFYSKEKFQIHGAGTGARSVTIAVQPLSLEVGHKFSVFGYESIGDDFSMGYLTGPPVMSLKPLATKSLAHLLDEAYETGHLVKGNKIDGIYRYKMSRTYWESSLRINNTLYTNTMFSSQLVKDVTKTQDYLLHISQNISFRTSSTFFTQDVVYKDIDYVFLLFMNHTGINDGIPYFIWGPGHKQDVEGMWMRAVVKNNKLVVGCCSPSAAKFTDVRQNFGLEIQQLIANSMPVRSGTFAISYTQSEETLNELS